MTFTMYTILHVLRLLFDAVFIPCALPISSFPHLLLLLFHQRVATSATVVTQRPTIHTSILSRHGSLVPGPSLVLDSRVAAFLIVYSKPSTAVFFLVCPVLVHSFQVPSVFL